MHRPRRASTPARARERAGLPALTGAPSVRRLNQNRQRSTLVARLPKTISKIAARTEKPPSAHARHKTDLAMTTTKSATPTANVEPAAAKVEPAAAKVELAANKVEPAAPKADPPASGRPAETSNEVIARAKTTIAAKLDDPRSAEFGEMKRAIRTNILGNSVDTICGSVKGKKASGESTGDRPFLYLVRDDEAYVVDGPPTSTAATAYRNICN